MNRRQKERLKKKLIVLINAFLGFFVGATFGAIALLIMIAGFGIIPERIITYYLMFYGTWIIPGLITSYAMVRDDLWIFGKEW